MNKYFICEAGEGEPLEWQKAEIVEGKTHEAAMAEHAARCGPGNYFFHVWAAGCLLHKTGCPMVTHTFKVEVS